MKRMLRALGAFTAALVVAGGTGVAVADSGAANQVPDDGLRRCINAKLKHSKSDPVTAADLAGLTELRCILTGVSSLQGLQQAGNLTELWVNGKDLKDLKPLAGLRKLVNLHVLSDSLTDLSPLAQLTQLQELLVSEGRGYMAARFREHRGPLSDVKPLAGLVNLNYLGLMGTSVTNLEPLVGLPKLRELDMEASALADVNAIARMSSVRWVMLNGTEVSDVAPLRNSTKLERLNVRSAHVADLSPVLPLGSAPWWMQDQEITVQAGEDGTAANPVRDIAGDPVTQFTNLKNVKLVNGKFQLVDPKRQGSAEFEADKMKDGEYHVLFSGVVTVLPAGQDEGAPPSTTKPTPVKPTPTETEDPATPSPSGTSSAATTTGAQGQETQVGATTASQAASSGAAAPALAQTGASSAALVGLIVLALVCGGAVVSARRLNS